MLPTNFNTCSYFKISDILSHDDSKLNQLFIKILYENSNNNVNPWIVQILDLLWSLTITNLSFGACRKRAFLNSDWRFINEFNFSIISRLCDNALQTRFHGSESQHNNNIKLIYNINIVHKSEREFSFDLFPVGKLK